LSIVLSKHDELEAFSIHLQNFFAWHSNKREHADAGILTGGSKRNDGSSPNEEHDGGVDGDDIDDDEDGDQDDNELEKEDVLEGHRQKFAKNIKERRTWNNAS